MQQMYETYRDIAEFRIVYIHEAHAADSGWSNDLAKSKNITEHKTYGQRCSTAQMLVDDKKLTIPTIIDGMDNATSEAYQAHPDRIYVVGKDGKLGVAGSRGPRGFEPGLRTVEKWLAEYKKTGVEPAIVESDDTEDLGDLEADLMAAHRAGEYEKALEIAGRMHELDPHDVSTLYNMACLHCLLNDSDKAYTLLEQAIENGYQDADHLVGDDDFKSIRGDDRFKRLVERVRQADRDAVEMGKHAGSIVGDWEMTINFRGREMDALMSIRLENGKLTGTWAGRGREMELSELRFEGDRLSFTRRMGPGMEMKYEGTVKGDRITGKYAGQVGEFESNGKRATY